MASGTVINMQTALSTAANTTTADLVSGTWQFIPKSRVVLIAKGSATGMYLTLSVGGITLVNDQPIPYTGTAGTLSAVDNEIVNQIVAGGRVELKLRNSTGGALTTDLRLSFEPL